jgi:DNA-binding Lrp family transcriptional regulator
LNLHQRTPTLVAPDGARLDDIDLRILRRLEQDARVSNQDLAESIGLSPSATLNRTRRLEQMRVIRGYRADFDPEVFTPWILVHVEIALTPHGRVERHRICEVILGMPEILDAWELMEKYDIGFRVVLPSLAASTSFQARFDPEGAWVRRWRCQPVLQVLKARASHPALALGEDRPVDHGPATP